jgi:DNA repair protein RecN (Recombination protein N)
MIERFFIKNYAIIDSLEFEPGKGFSVFSGETGAGKSIIVGALGLLLGEKGDVSLIRTNEEKAIVEAEFSVKNPFIAEKMKAMGIENPESLIIRREVLQNGKSRVFINGQQDMLSKLEEIGEWLVDIHGQHDHQLILNQKVHLDILDSYGKLSAEKEDIKSFYQEFLKKVEEKKELEQDEQKLAAEKFYWETAVSDIANAKMEEGEEEQLTETIKKMENAEKISAALSSAYSVLYEEELSVTGRLSRALGAIRELEGLDSRYQELLEILEGASAQIGESVHLIGDYQREMDYDEKTMEEWLDRLELIKDLKRKYKKNSITELKGYAQDCSTKLSRFENRAQELEKIAKQIEEIKVDLIEKSKRLSKKRQEIAKELAQKIKDELSFLGMEKSEFIVDIKYVKEDNSPFVINEIPIKLNETGMDRAEFFISSNVGEEPRPLKKVASGGEISRVMLALKSIFAENDAVDTLIFDEIDVGIGGLTANNVAVKMKELSASKQIVVITHLAQIASKAESHFAISKIVENNKTYTKIEKMEGERRVEEIARMLGGESSAALTHAREMLK